ncbi:hypothetical protein SLEP1_g31261, partial [Rubroshorea leprosula]
MRTMTCNNILLMTAALVLSGLFSPVNCRVVKPSDAVDCARNYVEIAQGQEGTEPNGIPIYSVQISNNCPSGCKISRLHIDCGEFVSNILVDPNTFKRINIGDCLVNDGEPLAAGAVISF